MPNRDAPDRRVAPPGKHQLAVMIWLCVFPTLTAINLLFGDWLRTLSSVPRTFVLATIAVPVVTLSAFAGGRPRVAWQPVP